MTAQDDTAGQDQRTGEAALIAIDLRHVVIEGDDILAARVDAGDIYLPLRSMCDALGVSYQGQVARIRRDEVLAEGLQPCVSRRAAASRASRRCISSASPYGWLASNRIA